MLLSPDPTSPDHPFPPAPPPHILITLHIPITQHNLTLPNPTHPTAPYPSSPTPLRHIPTTQSTQLTLTQPNPTQSNPTQPTRYIRYVFFILQGDQTGLGKTLQSITLVAYLRDHLRVDGPYLVVVPVTVLSNCEWVC